MSVRTPSPSILLLALFPLTACPLVCSDLGWGEETGEGTGSASTSTSMTGGEPATTASTLATTSSGGMTGSGGTSGGTLTTSAGSTTGDLLSGSSADTSSSSSSGAATDTGEELPAHCQGPVLDYGCAGPWQDELAVSVDSNVVVPANSNLDIELDASECGDETRRATGLIVDVGVTSACYWSMHLSLVCPSGQALTLTTPGMCGPCSQVDKPYHAIFRATGEACEVCDFENSDSCILLPPDPGICNPDFLDACEFPAGEPWRLRVETGDTSVHVASVALRLALAN